MLYRRSSLPVDAGARASEGVETAATGRPGGALKLSPFATTTVVVIAVWAPAGLEAQGQGGPATPLFGSAEASAPPELAITFEEAAVVAADLTPGGDAAFWSVAREPLGYLQRVVRHYGVEVVDAQGEARFEPDTGEVLLKSLWAVADIESGALAIAAPPGFVLRELPFPGNGFAVGAPGRVNSLRHPKSSLDLLMVRPGVGAWRLRAHDTGAKDRDGEDDDQVMTDLDDLEPFDPAGPEPPERYARDDLIVVIDPHDLTYYATRLLGPPAPEEEEP